MEYTIEEVRARFERFASDHGKWPGAVVRSGDAYKLMNTHIQWVAWQAAYADSIERAQAGVTDDVVESALNAQFDSLRVCDFNWTSDNQNQLMRTALLAVWPVATEPVEGHIIRVLSHDGECEVAARWEGDEGAYVTLDAIRGATDPDVKTPMSAPAEPAQATTCAGCGKHKPTPLRIDAMGGYVCLTCIDEKLSSLLGEFGYPEAQPADSWRGGGRDGDCRKHARRACGENRRLLHGR